MYSHATVRTVGLTNVVVTDPATTWLLGDPPVVMMFAYSSNGLSHCKEEDTPEPYLEQTIEAFLKLVQKTVAL